MITMLDSRLSRSSSSVGVGMEEKKERAEGKCLHNDEKAQERSVKQNQGQPKERGTAS